MTTRAHQSDDRRCEAPIEAIEADVQDVARASDLPGPVA